MRNIILIVILVLLQALLLNRIHLFGVATPLAYVYFVLQFSRKAKPWISMVVCFMLGVVIDMFSNTPGLAASSLTFLAFVRPLVLEAFLRNEDPEDFVPSFRTMGIVRYFFFALLIVLLYCVTLFSLEAFTFTHWYEWALNVTGCTVLTFILILVTEGIRK